MTAKSFLLWLPLAILDTLHSLAAMLLMSWWLPLFASKDGWLPRWLGWYQTFDASLDWGWQGGTYAPSASLHWDRTKWLFRNSAYGFSYFVTGIPMDTTKWTVHKFIHTQEKVLFWATSTDDHFNLYYHGPLGMYKLGYKAWNYFDADKGQWKTEPWGPEWRTQIVLSVNPFKRKSAA